MRCDLLLLRLRSGRNRHAPAAGPGPEASRRVLFGVRVESQESETKECGESATRLWGECGARREGGLCVPDSAPLSTFLGDRARREGQPAEAASHQHLNPPCRALTSSRIQQWHHDQSLPFARLSAQPAGRAVHGRVGCSARARQTRSETVLRPNNQVSGRSIDSVTLRSPQRLLRRNRGWCPPEGGVAGQAVLYCVGKLRRAQSGEHSEADITAQAPGVGPVHELERALRKLLRSRARLRQGGRVARRMRSRRWRSLLYSSDHHRKSDHHQPRPSRLETTSFVFHASLC